MTVNDIRVKILPNTTGSIKRIVATAELHFLAPSPLAGMKLIGFTIVEHTPGTLRVWLPSRHYSVGRGEQRVFALLRPVDTAFSEADDRVRDLILDAYRAYLEEVLSPPASGVGASAV